MTDHDEFLSRFRAAPRREFAERLYAELADERVRQPMFAKISPFVRRAALALAALVLVFGAVMALSPSARAIAQGWLELWIGGMKFVQVPDDGSTVHVPRTDDPVTVIPSEYPTLEEAQQILPFKMPTWLPEGFEPNDPTITMTRFPDGREGGGPLTQIRIRWFGSPLGWPTSIMLAVDDDPESGLLVGESSGAREVTFNGQTGALLYGMWNADTGRYEGPGEITLMWVDGGLKYTLMGNTNGGVSSDDLISIAASME